ncbi:unnamed protein product [Schistosoma mattheei]|uniref:Uncharacterized protein n=1 Tax=Schistosoma mattheei TaxID=31246 RepID=A0A183NWZ9_9TREM|nr:unnamed protein product [Schistosoma mattheei]
MWGLQRDYTTISTRKSLQQSVAEPDKRFSRRPISRSTDQTPLNKFITNYSNVRLSFLLTWCIFSINFVNINAYQSDNLLRNHWLSNIQDDDLRQAIEQENITEEQLRDPHQFDRLLKRLIFLSPKHLRRFMKLLREWNNLSQRIR